MLPWRAKEQIDASEPGKTADRFKFEQVQRNIIITKRAKK